MTTAQALADALRVLDELAASGDGNARHAAAILRRARSAGRPEIDDNAALDEVEKLSRDGHGRRAIVMVARKLAATPAGITAAAKRLREKRRRRKKFERNSIRSRDGAVREGSR